MWFAIVMGGEVGSIDQHSVIVGMPLSVNPRIQIKRDCSLPCDCSNITDCDLHSNGYCAFRLS